MFPTGDNVELADNTHPPIHEVNGDSLSGYSTGDDGLNTQSEPASDAEVDGIKTPVNGSSRDSSSPCRERHESTMSDGLELVHPQDSLKKREPYLEDADFQSPLDFLPGEYIIYQCRNVQGHAVMCTNYRLFIARPLNFVNCPIKTIESADCSDLTTITVQCKDGHVFSCNMPSTDICYRLLKTIRQEMLPPTSKSAIDTFAMSFSVNISQRLNWHGWELKSQARYSLSKEIKRLGFKESWRITTINEKYRYCISYPKENLVPRGYEDESLERVAKFRSMCRFPSAIWRNKDNGAVLLRSSQPEIGVFCQRSTDDESLMQAIIKACGCSTAMTVIDARSYTAAMANRAKGGGFEYSEYYTNSEVKFMGLPNIHAIRGSFSAVRTLLNSNVTSANWYSSLDNTKWMFNLSLLLEASILVADRLTTQPVLVHCSDGWDRTSQIVSLAQLILDPHYRTFKGFQTLIEKDWLLFGHKFADRCGHSLTGTDINEMSPVFLQWVDAVHQLCVQFPTAFEFNHLYLMRLIQHTYSCMFGTFLFNNEQEREKETLSTSLLPVWSYLNSSQPQFINKLYTPHVHKMLNVNAAASELVFWKEAYFSPLTDESAVCNSMAADQSADDSSSLVRSHSHSDISSSLDSTTVKTARRLSDADISTSFTGVVGEGNSVVDLQSNTSMTSLSGMVSTSPAIPPNSFTSDLVGERLNQFKAEQKQQGNPDKEFQFNKYLDSDGLALITDPVQQRMNEIETNLTRKIRALEKQIAELETRPPPSPLPVCQCGVNGKVSNGIEKMGSGPPSADSCSDHSDSSWEAVSYEKKMTLWVPDHAAVSCTSCHQPFTMLIRRRHHCRRCGLIFCMECANHYTPVPEQELYDPVRVCSSCHQILIGEVDDDDVADALESSVSLRQKNGSSRKEPSDTASLTSNSSSTKSYKSSKAIPIPGAIKRRAWSGTDIPAVPSPPVSANRVDDVPVGDMNTSQHSLHSNGSSSSRICQTCSQESLNVEYGIDGTHRNTMGARAEC